MIILYLIVFLLFLWYIGLVLSFINDRRQKDLKYRNLIAAIIITLIFPFISIIVHIKGVIYCYKKDDKKMMKKMFLLATIDAAVGVSYLNEYITRLVISEAVYRIDISGRKIDKTKSEDKIAREVIFSSKTYNNYKPSLAF